MLLSSLNTERLHDQSCFIAFWSSKAQQPVITKQQQVSDPATHFSETPRALLPSAEELRRDGIAFALLVQR